MKGFNVSYKRRFPVAICMDDGKINVIEEEEIGIILHLEEGDKAQDVFEKAKAFVVKNKEATAVIELENLKEQNKVGK